jgi:hypothetical protein
MFFFDIAPEFLHIIVVFHERSSSVFLGAIIIAERDSRFQMVHPV